MDAMFMVAGRIEADGKPALQLFIYGCAEDDVVTLERLGISEIKEDRPDCRYAIIHSQKEFLEMRDALLTHYSVIKEMGPKVFLAPKDSESDKDS